MLNILCALFLCLHLSWAQDFISAMTSTEGHTLIELENAFSPSQKIDHGPHETAVHQRNFSVQHPAFKNEKMSFVVGARWSGLEFSDNQELRDYQHLQGSLTLKRYLPENKFWSFSGSYGSASDRPFMNGRDGIINGTYFRKTSPKWSWLVNYSNNRTFLNNVPLPGFVYTQEISRNRVMILGFPFIYWFRQEGQWGAKFLLLGPWSHRLKLLYITDKGPDFFIGHDQWPQTFFRSDREERRERVFWVERRLIVGMEDELHSKVKYEFFGGLAYDRQVFEATNFTSEKQHLKNLSNGPFVALGLKFNF